MSCSKLDMCAELDTKRLCSRYALTFKRGIWNIVMNLEANSGSVETCDKDLVTVSNLVLCSLKGAIFAYSHF